MKSVLGDSFDDGTYHSGANRLARELATRAFSETTPDGKTRKIELNLAASMFLDRTLQVQPAFLDLLASEYDSGVRRLDFMGAHEAARMTINDWVAEQTRDKILDLLPPDSINSETPFVLVNALYFYGSWLKPFSHEGTGPADFHTLGGETKQVDTMHAERLTTGYASATDYSVAQLRYVNDDLSMIVVLPAQDKFESVRSGVSAAWLAQTVDSLESTLLSVSLPKWKMTVGSFSLKAGLEALGMKQAFTQAADFSGVAPATRIEDVLQKAFIAVDEDGTEAAAATAVIAGPTSAPVDQPIPFTVDRPFLFFIRDANGVILFSGHVVDPSGE
jgi:serpin B